MADTIGTVRVELIADPSGIQRGIEQASGALTRIVAVGTFVGNVLSEAFAKVTAKFFELTQGLLEGRGDVWDELSANGQRAVSAISRGFDSLNDSASGLAAQVVERVAPAFAELVGQLQQFREGSGLLQVILDGVVLALKGIVSVAVAAVAGVRDLFNSLEALGSMAIRLAQTLGDLVKNITSLSGMGEAIRQGMADIGRINEEASKRTEQIWQDARDRIANIWSDTPISGPRLQHMTDEAKRHLRLLAEEAKRVFELTRTPVERMQLEIDRLNANPFIKGETLSRAIDMVKEKYSGLRDTLRSLGQSIASTFTDAILEGKKLSDVLQGLLKNIARILLNKVFTDILLGSNTKQGGVGGLLGSLFGGLTGFASGGSFKVGGAGGTDSQMVAFRATPGERVVVGHDAGPGSGGGGQPCITINNYANAEVSASRTSEEDLEVTVRGLVRDEMGSSRMNPVMGGKFGLRPRVRSR